MMESEGADLVVSQVRKHYLLFNNACRFCGAPGIPVHVMGGNNVTLTRYTAECNIGILINPIPSFSYRSMIIIMIIKVNTSVLVYGSESDSRTALLTFL